MVTLEEERSLISRELVKKSSHRSIATMLSRHHSVISREVHRTAVMSITVRWSPSDAQRRSDGVPGNLLSHSAFRSTETA
ncbi:MAG: helix-turn-helix domain-containing protein [Pseudonocardiaceae bacterium]